MARAVYHSHLHPHSLRVVHRLPGRVRFKSHHLKGNYQAAQHIRRQLGSISGIHLVETNPTTGSITLHHHLDALPWTELLLKVVKALGLAAIDLTPAEVEAFLEASEESPVLTEAAATLGNTLLETLTEAWRHRGHIQPALGLTLVVLGIRSLMAAD
jgi:hypothetical protein